MASELIATALKTADETKAIAFGDDVLADTGKIFAAEFPGAKVLVVADENTFGAAGDVVVASLKEAGVEFVEDPYVFQELPRCMQATRTSRSCVSTLGPSRTPSSALSVEELSTILPSSPLVSSTALT